MSPAPSQRAVLFPNSSSDGESEDLTMCHLCSDAPAPALMKKFQGVYICNSKCMPAVRSCRGQLGKNEEALEKLDSMLQDDPAAWRARVMPFRERGGRKAARASARADVANVIVRQTAVVTMKKIGRRSGR